MPTEQRRGRNQESSPAFPREQPAERSQEGAVNGPVPDAAVDLALKDPDLVTEDHDFDVLVGCSSPGGQPGSPVALLRENVKLTTASAAYSWVNPLQIWGIGTVDLVAGEIKVRAYVPE